MVFRFKIYSLFLISFGVAIAAEGAQEQFDGLMSEFAEACRKEVSLNKKYWESDFPLNGANSRLPLLAREKDKCADKASDLFNVLYAKLKNTEIKLESKEKFLLIDIDCNCQLRDIMETHKGKSKSKEYQAFMEENNKWIDKTKRDLSVLNLIKSSQKVVVLRPLVGRDADSGKSWMYVEN